jgi:hypothetical protein
MLRSRYFQSQLAVLMEQTTRNQVPITRQLDLFVFEPPMPLQEKFQSLERRFLSFKRIHREALRQRSTCFKRCCTGRLRAGCEPTDEPRRTVNPIARDCPIDQGDLMSECQQSTSYEQENRYRGDGAWPRPT